MPFPHQPAAEQMISEMSARWSPEDMTAIIHSAERSAQKAKAQELTRDHLKAAEEYYQWMCGKHPRLSAV
jgi:hypothetical protein